MTEKEKMLSGELYDPSDPELLKLLLKARKLARKYNQMDEEEVDVVLSSPYRRAIDTIKDYTDVAGLKIEIEEDFRERKIGGWIENFDAYV